MACLQDKYEDFFPKVINNMKYKSFNYTFSFKFDILNFFINSIYNLINIIHFEEINGFIQMASKKTGLIPSEKAIKIYHNLFKVLKKLNKYGNNFYNISSQLLLNVTINPGNLQANTDIELSITDLKDKGIKIHFYAEYLLRLTGAHSLQTVVFDSPFVSIRGNRTNKGGTSSTFVGITLYDKEGKEIFVKDLKIKKFKPIIYYAKRIYNSMTTCLFFNEEKNIMEDTGIITETEFIDGEEYIKCIPNHLSSFSIGSYKKAKILDTSPNFFSQLYQILKKMVNIIAIVFLIIFFVFLFLFCLGLISNK